MSDDREQAWCDMLVLKYCTGVIMYCTYYTLQQFCQTVILLKIVLIQIAHHEDAGVDHK